MERLCHRSQFLRTSLFSRANSFSCAGSGLVIRSITLAREGKWFTKQPRLGGGPALKGESCGVARKPGDVEVSGDAG